MPTEPRSYRETIAFALAELRPDTEVRAVEPEDLDGELVHFAPQLVVCSRVTDLLGRQGSAWIELYPDLASETVVSLDGRDRTVYPDMDLDTIGPGRGADTSSAPYSEYA